MLKKKIASKPQYLGDHISSYKHPPMDENENLTTMMKNTSKYKDSIYQEG
jgi:hypothetical protein